MCVLDKKSWYFKIFLISFGFVLSAKTRRKAKFLSFNALDDDIRVDLDFTVPFISIPIKKSVDAMFGGSEFAFPTANINVAGLALGGAMVFGSVVVLPLILKAYAAQYPGQQYAKLLETTHFGSDGLLNFASGLLTDGRGLNGCMLKLACLTTREPGQENVVQIFHQISSNSILSNVLNSTALEDALQGGREGRQCETHHQCPIETEQLRGLFKNMLDLGRR